jgi:uncharacterized protein YqgQ
MNYAILVAEKTLYPVRYTIKQNGTKVYENTSLEGKDMTENQIKELYFKGFFNQKPSEQEIDNYLDYLISKKTFKSE